MDNRDQILADITAAVQTGLHSCSTEELLGIFSHIKEPSAWCRVEICEGLAQERDALLEDLRGTCSVCADSSIKWEPVLGCYECAHLDRARIVGFQLRTNDRPKRCPHWNWRGVQT